MKFAEFLRPNYDRTETKRKMKIKKLTIETAQINSQLEFYEKKLGVPVLEKWEKGFSVKIGYSVLVFHQAEKPNPYHIAFHIGANQEKEAAKWLEKRVSIIQNKNKNIVDFPAWNAKSIYFYDKDQNVIELISRKHLHPLNEKFSVKSWVGIAEIGLSTNTVEEFFQFLNTNFNLEAYFGEPEVFCAIGDENGLLITVDKNQKTWFPTEDKALPGNFDLQFERKGKLLELNYEHEKLSVM